MGKPCACSWCNEEVVEGCLSVMGQPTCRKHSAEETVAALRRLAPGVVIGRPHEYVEARNTPDKCGYCGLSRLEGNHHD